MRRLIAAAVAVLGLGVVSGGPTRAADDQGAVQVQDASSAATVARGKYLTDMGDCAGCHVGAGRPYMAGGQYMGMPFGEISTPNITPDKATGIGLYTDAEWLRLMHHGIGRRGEYIYPAMPYPWYTTVSDADLLAIKAYLFSLKPVHAPREPNKIWFPFTLRPAIALWDVLFVPSERFAYDPSESAKVNRGRYIVTGLEHCGECHNHRNFLGNTEVADKLMGGPITKWYAPSLHPDKLTGIGDFTEDQLANFFKHGHDEAMGPVAGPMGEAIDVSTMKLTDGDLHAVAAYLLSLPPTPAYAASDPSLRRAGMASGRNTYLSHCASCHQENGQGLPGHIPALDGNGMVRATGPQDVLRVVYGGHEARGPWGVMPGVGADMTDAEVVSVTNYVRQAWSNRAPPSASLLLASLIRQDTHTLTNGQRPNGCPSLANAALSAAIGDSANGIAATLATTNEANLLQSVDALIPKVRSAAPDVTRADLVNGLMIAYCPTAQAATDSPPGNRWWHMTRFAERLYTQLTTNGAY